MNITPALQGSSALFAESTMCNLKLGTILTAMDPDTAQAHMTMLTGTMMEAFARYNNERLVIEKEYSTGQEGGQTPHILLVMFEPSVHEPTKPKVFIRLQSAGWSVEYKEKKDRETVVINTYFQPGSTNRT